MAPDTNRQDEARMRLTPPPHGMDEAAFVARFGAVYEHSPWIPEGAWRRGLTPDADTVGGLASTLADEVERAGGARQLELIRAHPDLGGKAALAGRLTAASAREQAGAGLAACTPEQFARLQRLNTDYTTKFGFPFIVAVTGLTRDQIIDGIAERLGHDAATERRRALDEIHRIAWLRLVRLAQASVD